jgi:CheY-like chemotaxis protein
MKFFPKLLDSPDQKRILVVDDSPVLSHAYASALCAWGYTVDTAVDGLAALARLRSVRYHLVITDYEMPRCNGIEFLAKARLVIDTNALPPFILITGTPLKDLHGQLDGFVATFAKPIGIQELRHELASRINNS